MTIQKIPPLQGIPVQVSSWIPSCSLFSSYVNVIAFICLNFKNFKVIKFLWVHRPGINSDFSHMVIQIATLLNIYIWIGYLIDGFGDFCHPGKGLFWTGMRDCPLPVDWSHYRSLDLHSSSICGGDNCIDRRKFEVYLGKSRSCLVGRSRVVGWKGLRWYICLVGSRFIQIRATSAVSPNSIRVRPVSQS